MKMNSQTAVGAFVMGGVALVLAAILVFGHFHIFNPPKLVSVVFRDSISGLTVGAPVDFRGVPIGAVNRIDVHFDMKTRLAYIPVTLALYPGKVFISDLSAGNPSTKSGRQPDIATLVAFGLRAELKTTSFVTGQSEVDLDFYPGSPANLPHGQTRLAQIPTRQSDIKNLEEQLSKLNVKELAKNANATLTSLHTLADTMNADLPPLIASVKHTAERSTTTVDIASRTMVDLQGRLAVALNSFDQLAHDSDQQVNQRGAQLNTLLSSSNVTVLKAHDVLVDLRGLTAENSAGRMNIDAALRDLAAASGSLRGLASDVEEDPKLLLTGRKP